MVTGDWKQSINSYRPAHDVHVSLQFSSLCTRYQGLRTHGDTTVYVSLLTIVGEIIHLADDLQAEQADFGSNPEAVHPLSRV